MKYIVLFLAWLGIAPAAPALAQQAITTPCSSANNGQQLIAPPRPPTAAEISGQPTPPTGQGPLLNMMDHFTCTGSSSTWTLTATYYEYRGGQQPTFVLKP